VEAKVNARKLKADAPDAGARAAQGPVRGVVVETRAVALGVCATCEPEGCPPTDALTEERQSYVGVDISSTTVDCYGCASPDKTIVSCR
jgi:hypothetical protein